MYRGNTPLLRQNGCHRSILLGLACSIRCIALYEPHPHPIFPTVLAELPATLGSTLKKKKKKKRSEIYYLGTFKTRA